MFSLSLDISSLAVETTSPLPICCINLGSWWDFLCSFFFSFSFFPPSPPPPLSLSIGPPSITDLRQQSTDSEKTSQATWGRLACEILRTDWEAAMEEVTKVKDLIEQKVVHSICMLIERC